MKPREAKEVLIREMGQRMYSDPAIQDLVRISDRNIFAGAQVMPPAPPPAPKPRRSWWRRLLWWWP
jgi:hypothetical protein